MEDITKVLTDYDTSYQGRCILPREKLINILSEHQRERLETGEGDIDVLLIDKDQRNTPYCMKLGFQNSYFLKRGWSTVVNNRKLVAGDVIRMTYDDFQNSSSGGGGGAGGGGVLSFNFNVYKHNNTGEHTGNASSTASNIF